jgi:hypothetical protein
MVTLASQTAAQSMPEKPADSGSDFELIKPAADFVQSLQKNSLAGWFAIVIKPIDFDDLEDDQDLGPSVLSAREHQDSYLVVVIPGHADWGPTHSVFFKDQKICAHLSSASPAKRQSIKKALEPGEEELFYQAVELTADNGTPIQAFRILSAGPR